MRNPDRIPKICCLLEEAWKKSPDERLGQFLSNYVYGHHQDIFFPEDDRVEIALKILVTPCKPKRKKR